MEEKNYLRIFHEINSLILAMFKDFFHFAKSDPLNNFAREIIRRHVFKDARGNSVVVANLDV